MNINIVNNPIIRNSIGSVATDCKINDSKRNEIKELEAEPIAVTLAISNEGKELAKTELTDELKEKLKFDAEKVSSAKDSETEKETEQALEEIQKAKERDYSKLVVEQNILDEMNQKSNELADETNKGMRDLEILVESLGYKIEHDQNTNEDKAGSDNINSIDKAGSHKVSVVLKKAFEHEEEIDEILSNRDKKVDKRLEHIAQNQELIRNIRINMEENSLTLSEADYKEYSKDLNKQIGYFESEINDDKKLIRDELSSIRDIKLNRLGDQTMSDASRNADAIRQNTSEEIRRQNLRDFMDKGNSKPWEVVIEKDEDEQEV